MALPPEPLQELLPRAAWIVEAEVKEVVSQRPTSGGRETLPGETSTGRRVGAQVVRLAITRVLRGDPKVTELTVEKPEAGYALRAGNKGPFLLDRSAPRPVILGRYGPDTHPLAKIEAALAK